MEPMGTETDSQDAVPSLPQRLIDAARVIRGRSAVVTPDELAAWRIELYQQRLEWESTLEKLNTWAARVAKRDQRAMERLTQEQEEQPQQELGIDAQKSRLRAYAFGGNGK